MQQAMTVCTSNLGGRMPDKTTMKPRGLYGQSLSTGRHRMVNTIQQPGMEPLAFVRAVGGPLATGPHAPK